MQQCFAAVPLHSESVDNPLQDQSGKDLSHLLYGSTALDLRVFLCVVSLDFDDGDASQVHAKKLMTQILGTPSSAVTITGTRARVHE